MYVYYYIINLLSLTGKMLLQLGKQSQRRHLVLAAGRALTSPTAGPECLPHTSALVLFSGSV